MLMRTHIAMQYGFRLMVRAYNSNPYVFETYEFFHLWHARPWSLLSFFSREEWKVTKEEAAGR